MQDFLNNVQFVRIYDTENHQLRYTQITNSSTVNYLAYDWRQQTGNTQ